MAEPKKRLTSTRSGNRQSHDALQKKSYSVCSNCKQSVVPHRICQNCGYFKGVKIVKLKDEKIKEKKIQEQTKDE
ncbi:MAG: 50S ribosomal protein L32 [Candidatus Berkelbacteria bacterium]|nr:50S ribosomal protein L32 [Candidatus Berkelbacteria bacterium]